jgi:tetratricopeptide (TPR) repeat protein
MFRQLHSFIIAFTCILLTGCSLPSQELITAERLLEDKPDSALLILQQISPEKLQSDKAKAFYNLLYIRVLDKKHLPLKPDSLLDFSISYYGKHPDGNKLAIAWLFKGRVYYLNEMYEKAVSCCLKSQDEIKDSTDYLLMGRICADIARIGSVQKDYNFARLKLKQATKYYLKGNNKLQYFYTMIEIGKSYSLCKDCKSALSYLRKADKLATDSMTKGDLLDQYAFAYYKTGKVDSALYYYRQSINYPYIRRNKAVRYMYISDK